MTAEDALQHNLELLRGISDRMNSLTTASKSTAQFDVLSRALIWTDEFPTGTNLPIHVIQHLVRYRTSVIIGKPDLDLEVYWNEAQKLFPKWVGFRAERCIPSALLVELYNKESENSRRRIERYARNRGRPK